MNKLNKESEAYFVKIDDTIVYHYDCNRKYYNNREGVGCCDIYSEFNRLRIKTIIIDPLFVNYKPKNRIDWFFGNLINLERIIGLEYLNTSEVFNMDGMFYWCKKLKELDVRKLNTSNVTSMNNMFSHCDSLTSLDLRNFDTSNVLTMREMFRNCKNLTTLNLSSFNTSKVDNMNWMFAYCTNLINLDISNFEVSDTTDMIQVFKYCSNLKTIYTGDGVKNKFFDELFKDCGSQCITLGSNKPRRTIL